MNIKIQDCFTEDGRLKFDPYRTGLESEKWYLYEVLFTEDGWLQDRAELKRLIERKKWAWDCDAVGLYHAERHASSTKGSYPTYYFTR